MTVSWLSPAAAPTAVITALRDGGSAELQPLQPGDTESLLAVFEGMSAAARADRYLVGMPRLPASVLAALVDVDGCDHVAWLAGVDGAPAGIARHVRVAPGTVEVAFEVVDAHRGRGLGSALLDAVTTVAAAHGVRRVRATVLASNAPSLRLLARLGIAPSMRDGVLEGEGALRLLDPPRVDRAAVVALATAQLEQISSARVGLDRERPCGGAHSTR